MADVARIDAFTADASGVLSPIAGSPFSSGNNIFLTVDPLGRFIRNGRQSAGKHCSVHDRCDRGGMRLRPARRFRADSNSTGNTRPGADAVDPNSSFVFASLTETSQIAVFPSVERRPDPVPGSPFPQQEHRDLFLW